MKARRRLPIALLLLGLLLPASQAMADDPRIVGSWVFNEKLSDSTDKMVGKAIKAMGGKTKHSWFGGNKELYRGGPPEQELYDRISYDRVLTIAKGEDAYTFTYADDFKRPVYTDDRSRSVSLTGLDEVKDFSFGHWEGDKFLVEAHPRDGGFADETYRLINNGTQLEASFYIKPDGFTVPVELKRVFDRKDTP